MVEPPTLELQVIVNGLPTLTTGVSLSTVTKTESLEKHPLTGCVAVKVYMVVDVGLAVVDGVIFDNKPAEGVHRYVMF